MFSGIIEAVVSLKGIEKYTNGGCQFEIEKFGSDFELGESVAIDGVCSTITKVGSESICVDYLPETLKKTYFSSLKEGAFLNLERSLKLGGRMNGHYVSGHVDITGTIKRLEKSGDFGEIEIEYLEKYRYLLVEKGSVCVNGIGLTVVELSDNRFTCHLVPHTFENTNLKNKRQGDTVNLEFDMMAKYLHRFYMLDKE